MYNSGTETLIEISLKKVPSEINTVYKTAISKQQNNIAHINLITPQIQIEFTFQYIILE